MKINAVPAPSAALIQGSKGISVAAESAGMPLKITAALLDPTSTQGPTAVVLATRADPSPGLLLSLPSIPLLSAKPSMPTVTDPDLTVGASSASVSGAAAPGPALVRPTAAAAATLAPSFAEVGSALAVVFADRLTLSRTAAAMLTEVPDRAGKPDGRFLLRLLEVLTGEPPDRLQLLELRDSPGSGIDETYGPQSGTSKPAESLHLLTQGTIHSADQKAIPFRFSLTAVRSALTGSVGTLEILDSLSIMKASVLLEYPGLASELAGNSLNFHAELSPQALWPLHSFLLSGLLSLGSASEADLDDGPGTVTPNEEDQAAGEESPPHKKKQAKLRIEDEVSALPEDGGPPVISGRRWLELELRHLRAQVRSWMGLELAALS